MVLKELIFNCFLLWEGVVVLKELIFNSCSKFGVGVMVLKELILTDFILERCGCLD